MRWLLFCLVLQACRAQQDLPPDLLLLAKIKVKMAGNLDRLPNYTCEQTIERSRRRAPDRKFELLDTVRIEVALVEGKELYGWRGANRIAESDLSNLVGGTIGNGDFGLLARSIFLGGGGLFTYAGETILDRRKMIRYDYRVPLLSSGYHLKVAPNEAVVAYHGSFWVEPETLDLVRLDVTADNIPLYLGLESASNTLEYRRRAIGGSDFLLPLDAEMLMVDLSGSENRNRTRFHACRQYAGQSVLSFADPPPDAPAQQQPQVVEVRLPDEFRAELELATPIDSNSAAVGDAVEASLRKNLKDRGHIIAPKGAILKGRITQLQKQGRSFAFSISFHSLEFPDGQASLSGRDNTVSMLTSDRVPCLPPNRCATGQTLGPLEVEANRLRLWRGFPLFLHSRLLKSEKQ
jgi:hypothetical protein